MNMRKVPTFYRALAVVATTGLAVAIVSGAVHYRFTVRLIEESVRNQMDTALQASLSYFDRTYAVPILGDLRLLESSPVVSDLLGAVGPEIYLHRPSAERLLLSVVRSKPNLYSSLHLIDIHGDERVVIVGDKRLRRYRSLFEDSGPEAPPRRLSSVFKRLSGRPIGQVVMEGPAQMSHGSHGFVVGIALREPEIGGFGGAIVAEVDLTDYINYLTNFKIFGVSMAWLFDNQGNAILEPPEDAGAPDPRQYLGSERGSEEALVVVSSNRLGSDDNPLFRLALSMSPEVHARQHRGAAAIAVTVLLVTVVFAVVIAVVVARQISAPLKTLCRLTNEVGSGDLNVSVCEGWGGELGQLARAFNSMVHTLRETTVSSAYVHNIIDSMTDTLLVVSPSGVIERCNRALLNLLQYEEHELRGKPLSKVLWDAHACLEIMRLKDPAVIPQQFETALRTKLGTPILMSFSGAVLRAHDGEVQGLVCVAQDITERKRAEEALRASEHRYRALYDDNPSMFFTFDASGQVLSVNRFGAQQLGYEVEELVGASAERIYADVTSGADGDTYKSFIDSPHEVHRREVRMRRKDGAELWVRETARVLEEDGGSLQILTVCEDVTETRKLSQQLTYQASHDALTGLINRREFEERLQWMLDSARANKTEHALCYLDLDQFKVINDTCGHIAGDELLRQLGAMLKEHVRKCDTLARLGGDEFGVLLECCSAQQGLRLANDLRVTIEDFRFIWGDYSFNVGVSIGVVPINQTSETRTEVLSAADNACYMAKEQGRNRIHLYRENDADLIRRHGEMQWVTRIHRALEEHRFCLYYQPIVPVKANAAAGAHYELLIRMQDENGQIIGPGAFLPAAERYSLSSKIDRWVFTTAMEWLETDPNGLDWLSVCAINLSGHSLGDKEFLDFVVATLRNQSVQPEKICFEVTETAAIANLAAATKFIRALKELGCCFALDDFGSGLSSFAYLKTLPVDYLKIDGMFVKNIVDDPLDFAMVRSINEIGRVMGKRTIAEFVENEMILARLQEIGIDYAQGYGVGRPEPIEMTATGKLYDRSIA